METDHWRKLECILKLTGGLSEARRAGLELSGFYHNDDPFLAKLRDEGELQQFVGEALMLLVTDNWWTDDGLIISEIAEMERCGEIDDRKHLLEYLRAYKPRPSDSAKGGG